VSFLFPTLRFLQRGALDERSPSASHPTIERMLLGACLSGVALLGTWASIQWAPSWADQLAMVDKLADKLVGYKITEDKPAAKILAGDILQDAKLREEKLVQKLLECNLAADREAATQWTRKTFEEIKDPNPKAYTQIGMAGGAILGTILAAFLGNWLGRRISYLLLCMSSLASALVFFQLNREFGWMFLATVFLAGGFTASFYGWLPLYLPELFRTPIRATGQGFSFNFGRIIAAIGALQTGNLMGLFKGSYPTACSIMSMIYLVGLVIIWLAPETHGKPLPD
jgi:MFS transporter, SHS family, sialic acid transporter